jgi:DNA polymerase III alpha subunit (gram-positive type)
MAIIADKINYLWLDTETTGLDPVRNDVIQLACIPVINGIRLDSFFNEFCQPFDWSTIDDKALEINHITKVDLTDFQPPVQMVKKFILVQGKFLKSIICYLL